jgi:hypothetical protein
MRRLLFLLAALVLLAAATPAWAATPAPHYLPGSATFQSDSTQGYADGGSYFYVNPEDAITLRGNDTSIRIDADAWTVILQAPAGKRLALGDVEHPGPDLSISGPGSCGGTRFRIVDLSFDAHGTVNALDLLVEGVCGADATLTGEVRLGLPVTSGWFASPHVVREPDTYPGTHHRPIPVYVANTSQNALAMGKPTLTGSSAYSVVSDDCPARLASQSYCEVQTQFTPSAAGPAEAHLTMHTSSGVSTTLLHGYGTPGTTRLDENQVAGASSSDQTFTVDEDPTRAIFDAYVSSPEVTVQVTPFRSFSFRASSGTLTTGTYDVPVDGSAGPSMQVVPEACSNPSFESFTVHEVALSGTGLEHAGISFTVDCTDGTTLTGSLDYHALHGANAPADTWSLPSTPGPVTGATAHGTVISWTNPVDPTLTTVILREGSKPPLTHLSGTSAGATINGRVTARKGEWLSLFPVDESGRIGARTSVRVD